MKDKLPYKAPVCEEDILEPENSLLTSSPAEMDYDLPDPGDEKDF